MCEIHFYTTVGWRHFYFWFDDKSRIGSLTQNEGNLNMNNLSRSICFAGIE